MKMKEMKMKEVKMKEVKMKEVKMKEGETCNNATADLGQPHLNKWQISNKIKTIKCSL